MGKIIKNVILILLLVTLGFSTASLAYLHFFALGDRDLSGTWTTELDMTEQAAVTALSWLQDIEAVSVTLEDVESCMQNLTIQVDLILDQTSNSGGTFECNVCPENYDACSQAAYEAFAQVFQELLGERLHMAGYTGSTDGETMEALVNETFGMSTAAYLMSYAPALLPSLEELQALYDGRGTYEVTEDILVRQFDGDAAIRSERFIRKDTVLILSEETGPAADSLYSSHYPMMYTLR